jgi:hypothetical protein
VVVGEAGHAGGSVVRGASESRFEFVERGRFAERFMKEVAQSRMSGSRFVKGVGRWL